MSSLENNEMDELDELKYQIWNKKTNVQINKDINDSSRYNELNYNPYEHIIEDIDFSIFNLVSKSKINEEKKLNNNYIYDCDYKIKNAKNIKNESIINNDNKKNSILDFYLQNSIKENTNTNDENNQLNSIKISQKMNFIESKYLTKSEVNNIQTIKEKNNKILQRIKDKYMPDSEAKNNSFEERKKNLSNYEEYENNYDEISFNEDYIKYLNNKAQIENMNFDQKKNNDKNIFLNNHFQVSNDDINYIKKFKNSNDNLQRNERNPKSFRDLKFNDTKQLEDKEKIERHKIEKIKSDYISYLLSENSNSNKRLNYPCKNLSLKNQNQNTKSYQNSHHNSNFNSKINHVNNNNNNNHKLKIKSSSINKMRIEKQKEINDCMFKTKNKVYINQVNKPSMYQVVDKIKQKEKKLQSIIFERKLKMKSTIFKFFKTPYILSKFCKKIYLTSVIQAFRHFSDLYKKKIAILYSIDSFYISKQKLSIFKTLKLNFYSEALIYQNIRKYENQCKRLFFGRCITKIVFRNSEFYSKQRFYFKKFLTRYLLSKNPSKDKLYTINQSIKIKNYKLFINSIIFKIVNKEEFKKQNNKYLKKIFWMKSIKAYVKKENFYNFSVSLKLIFFFRVLKQKCTILNERKNMISVNTQNFKLSKINSFFINVRRIIEIINKAKSFFRMAINYKRELLKNKIIACYNKEKILLGNIAYLRIKCLFKKLAKNRIKSKSSKLHETYLKISFFKVFRKHSEIMKKYTRDFLPKMKNFYLSNIRVKNISMLIDLKMPLEFLNFIQNENENAEVKMISKTNNLSLVRFYYALGFYSRNIKKS